MSDLDWAKKIIAHLHEAKWQAAYSKRGCLTADQQAEAIVPIIAEIIAERSACD